MTRESLLLELESTRAALRDRDAELARERDALRVERALRAEKEAEIERLLGENAQLRHRLDVMARRMFGKSSEKLDPGQLLLAFAAAKADSLETALGEETPATPRPRRVRPSRKKAHANLPVREVRIDPSEVERV